MTHSASLALRTLGNSDLQLTPIGFGAWAIGGGNWEFAWGPQDDNESIAAIHRALDLGINWIDTAAIYGLGHSEEVVAARSESLSPQALRLYQVLHALARGPLHLPLPHGRLPGRGTGRLAPPPRPSKPSTSTRFTGPIPRPKSKRPGRPWPASANRAKSAGSASPISMSRR